MLNANNCDSDCTERPRTPSHTRFYPAPQSRSASTIVFLPVALQIVTARPVGKGGDRVDSCGVLARGDGWIDGFPIVNTGALIFSFCHLPCDMNNCHYSFILIFIL